MPVHDWTKTYTGVFHSFHGTWLFDLVRALNGGILPPEYYALGEQVEDPRYPPRPRVITVRHRSGNRLVAMIEIVSSGNKRDSAEIGALVEKTVVTLSKRVHVLLIDVHPPGPFDPQGIHNLVWIELGQEPVPLPPERPLLFASYLSHGPVESFLEPRAVGDILPDMPLFLSRGLYVNVPLERTYMGAYAGLPAHLRREIEGHAAGA
jgi:hypothetical protein